MNADIDMTVAFEVVWYWGNEYRIFHTPATEGYPECYDVYFVRGDRSEHLGHGAVDTLGKARERAAEHATDDMRRQRMPSTKGCRAGG